jgi:hypothetical protein
MRKRAPNAPSPAIASNQLFISFFPAFANVHICAPLDPHTDRFVNATKKEAQNALTSLKVGVPELGVLALEEGAKTGLEEIGKEVAAQFVPVVGSVFKIAIGIHEKRELLQERREHMEQLAKARLGPGPTDDMLTLTANFQQDDQTIREFVELIDKLAADLTNRVLPELT